MLVLFFLLLELVLGQLTTELYETCTGEQGYQARCGPGANCLLIGGVPTCHCIRDLATGLKLAGNPYRGCTWDISGTWSLYSYTTDNGFSKLILSPMTNEPFVIRIDRTDAILKTQYMTGAIFIVTAVTSFSVGVCARIFVDVNDNRSVIIEVAEGFVDASGRSMFFRNRVSDVSLIKKYPKKPGRRDVGSLTGHWKRADGSRVKIADFINNDASYKRIKSPYLSSPAMRRGYAYWYNDNAFGAPALRLSTALFLDDTLGFEQEAFQTDTRFVQLGFFGELAMGSNSIRIVSPADGEDLFVLRRDLDIVAVNHNQYWQNLLAPKVVEVPAGANLFPSRLLSNNASSPATARRLSEADDVFYMGTSRARFLQQSIAPGQFMKRRLQGRTEETFEKYPEAVNLYEPLPKNRELQNKAAASLNAPKSSLEDLLRIAQGGPIRSPRQEPTANNNGESERRHMYNSMFPTTPFFGDDDENGSETTIFRVLWEEAAKRLLYHESVADSKLKRNEL